MKQEETGLFQVGITEEGKKYIRKFASLSYYMLALVIGECCVTIYWNVEGLLWRTSAGYFLDNLYHKVVPYTMILGSLLIIFSNVYYLGFPHQLLRGLETNNETVANNAFRLLFRGAVIFFFSLIMNTAMIIWSLSNS